MNARGSKRVSKPRRHKGHYAGNLIAFKQLHGEGRMALQAAEIIATCDESIFSAATEHKIDLRVSANSDSVNSGADYDIQMVRLGNVAAAVFVVLATAVEVSSVWSSGEVYGSAQAHPDTETVLPSITTQTETQTQATTKKETQTLAAVSTEPDLYSIVDETGTTHHVANAYIEKHDLLLAQNASLQVEVDILNQETMALENELLQLEWAVVALKSKFQENVETRTVYNIVNVPIGGDADQFDNYNVENAGNGNYIEPLDNVATQVDVYEGYVDYSSVAQSNGYGHSYHEYMNQLYNHSYE